MNLAQHIREVLEDTTYNELEDMFQDYYNDMHENIGTSDDVPSWPGRLNLAELYKENDATGFSIEMNEYAENLNGEYWIDLYASYAPETNVYDKSEISLTIDRYLDELEESEEYKEELESELESFFGI